MWLVTWLLARVSKVFQWFGDSYAYFYDKLSRFFYYLGSWAIKAKNWAIDFLYPKIISYYQSAKDRIEESKNSILNWVAKQIAGAITYLDNKIGGVRSLLGFETSKLSTEDQRLADKLGVEIGRSEKGIKGWVKSLFSILFAPFKWILAFRDLLEGIKTLFSEENVKRLSLLLTSLFTFILDFATQPITTILAIIQPIILELINFSVAYALGSEKYELPEWPDWNSFGSGGGGVFINKDVKRQLSAPLDHLRISGYRFNNPAGHMGLDLGLARGQNVYSMHDGIIEYTNKSFVGYGFQITVGGGHWWSRYSHLQTILVRPGQSVKKGELIGRGNSTGNSTGDHLHLEIKYKGSFTDPEKILF